MKLPWVQGELVFCDLREATRFLRKHDPELALRFLRASYDTFDFIGANPEIGRLRLDAGLPDVRSWQVRGFRSYLILYSVEPARVLIHRVFHGSRDIGPELLD